MTLSDSTQLLRLIFKNKHNCLNTSRRKKEKDAIPSSHQGKTYKKKTTTKQAQRGHWCNMVN